MSDEFLDHTEHERFTSVLRDAVTKGQLTPAEFHSILYENGRRLLRRSGAS
ncbi:MAG: hypothetical protein AB7G93_03665 [Bdellovibrionales bacterium]